MPFVVSNILSVLCQAARRSAAGQTPDANKNVIPRRRVQIARSLKGAVVPGWLGECTGLMRYLCSPPHAGAWF